MPLDWDHGEPWELRVDVAAAERRRRRRLTTFTRCACRAGSVAATSGSRSPTRRSSRRDS